MSQNPHLGDTFNLLQWQIPVSPTPSYSIPFIGGHSQIPTVIFTMQFNSKDLRPHGV